MKSKVYRCIHSWRARYVGVYTHGEQGIQVYTLMERKVYRCIHSWRARYIGVYTLGEQGI